MSQHSLIKQKTIPNCRRRVSEECAHKHMLFFEWNFDRCILNPLSLSTHPPPGSLPSLWATSPEAPLKATPLTTTCKRTDTWTCIKQTFLPARNTWWRKNNHNPIQPFLTFEPTMCVIQKSSRPAWVPHKSVWQLRIRMSVAGCVYATSWLWKTNFIPLL